MPIISISNLSKAYVNGTKALDDVNLDVAEGEIIALLGPNGAGKTTLISTICGLLTYDSGGINVDGYDTVTEYRRARKLIGLVPQEVMLEPFETVYDTVRFTRGMFGYPEDKEFINSILQKLSLFDKQKQMIKELSGGMKRRVMIAKALSHNPKILFLDEPTAGVDVELRRDMWNVVDSLKSNGVTIVLTTHYIEEAEMMADRIALLNKGQVIFVENKESLIARMGKKELTINFQSPISSIPDALSKYKLALSQDRFSLIYSYDNKASRTGITRLMKDIAATNLILQDLKTTQSSLEDIFVNMIRN
ncbi:ABC transporter ATP-binding protein [Alphaproteobacteria bacterium]|nr:ABC transporter ATP-binding protein [Alphaproteobacteria bacterium]